MTPAEVKASQWIVYTSLILQCLCFANSAVNPILYAVLSENFKKSFAKACGRSPKFDEAPSAHMPRVPSWRTETGSQYQPTIVGDDEDPSDGEDDEHRRLSDRQLRIPSYTSPSTCVTSCNSMERSHPPAPRSHTMDQRMGAGGELQLFVEPRPILQGNYWHLSRSQLGQET